MKRRALLLGSQTNGLRGVHSDVAAVDAFLAAREFERRVLLDADATRDGILAALRALVDDSADGDVIVLYYSGHGGRIANPQHASDSDEPRHYTCIIPFDHKPDDFRAIFSAELSVFLAELSLKTRNITVILDCCHAEHALAGETLVPKAIELPWRSDVEKHRDWLREQGYDLRARAEYAEGNPHVVRMAACKSSQSAYELVTAEGDAHGLMTDALLRVLSDAGDAAPPWHAIAADVCARVTARYSTQEPLVLGPSERLLFDTIATPRTDVLTLRDREGVPYLSGGSLHGVALKSRYLLMPVNANRADRELALAEAEVVEVFTDRARVVLEPRDGAPAPKPGTRAYLVDPQVRRHPVALVGLAEPLGDALALRITASPRLRVQEPESTDPAMSLRASEGGLTLHDRAGLAVRKPWPPDPAPTAEALQAIVEYAEQLARVDDLLDLPPAEGPTLLPMAPTLRWGRVGDVTSVFLPSAGARLQVSDRIYIRAASNSPVSVYVSILRIDVDRSIKVMTSGSPSGVELRPGETYTLGLDDLGQTFGVPLEWPAHVPTNTPQPVRFVAICTDLPIDLRSLESDAGTAALRRSLDELLDPQGRIVHKGPESKPRSARYLRATLEILLETSPMSATDPIFVPRDKIPLEPEESTPPPQDGAPVQYTTTPRTLPIPMLYVSALPAGMQTLNFDAERRAIRDVLAVPTSRLYTFDDQPAASRRDVIRELEENKPGILHISCHGEEYKGILLEDDDRQGIPDVVPPEWLIARVKETENLGLVTMSACHSDVPAIAIADACKIDAIGFRGEIAEHYARWFYTLLFEMLARGLNVADAYVRALGSLPEPVQAQVVHAGPGVFPARLVRGPFPLPDPENFQFVPSNINFDGIDLDALVDIDIIERGTLMSTEGKELSYHLRNAQFKLIEQSDGSQIGVYYARNIRIDPKASLELAGVNAGALVALGEMRIFGSIDAAPSGSGKSPGGYTHDGSDDPGAGGPGGGAPGGDSNASAGGSYGGRGGRGAATPGYASAEPGEPYGTLELTPLVGGSAGGRGYMNGGGSGGGALQLVAGKRLLVGPNARINCGGGAGLTGGAAGNQQGHGGGSGGGLLLEAPIVEIAGVLAANGGSAGAGSFGSLRGQDGLASDQPAVGSAPGGGWPPGARGSAGTQIDGEDGITLPNGKVGGGGGGAGRIRINTLSGSAKITGTISPSLDTACATQGKITLRT